MLCFHLNHCKSIPQCLYNMTLVIAIMDVTKRTLNCLIASTLANKHDISALSSSTLICSYVLLTKIIRADISTILVACCNGSHPPLRRRLVLLFGGPICSVVSVHDVMFNESNWTEHWNKTINVNKRKPKQSCLATYTKTENNHPQNTMENMLPKYGAQSGTTIDRCLWLRTIPGQTQK